MVEAKIIDKEGGRASIHTGEFSLSFTGDNEQSYVTLLGTTNLYDLAKITGTCMRNIFSGTWPGRIKNLILH